MYMSQEPSTRQEMRHTSAWMKHWTAGNHFQSISKTRQSIHGTISGKRRTPDRISRSDNCQPYGQVCTTSAGSRSDGHDRKRQEKPGSDRCGVRNGCVYLAAIGGAGALLSKCIKSSEVIAYEDLGTEAIRKLQVENLPLIVVIDSEGNNLYETAIKEYAKI